MRLTAAHVGPLYCAVRSVEPVAGREMSPDAHVTTAPPYWLTPGSVRAEHPGGSTTVVLYGAPPTTYTSLQRGSV